jgi:hypothetical protein
VNPSAAFLHTITKWLARSLISLRWIVFASGDLTKKHISLEGYTMHIRRHQSISTAILYKMLVFWNETKHHVKAYLIY